MEHPSTAKEDQDGGIPSGDVKQRQPTPRGGILSRAIHALDFRSRECSGNETDNTPRGHGVRFSSLQKTSFLGGKGSDSNLKRHMKMDAENKSCDGLYEKAQSHKHKIPPFIDEYLQVAKTRENPTPSSRLPQRPPITSAAVNLTVDALKSSPGQGMSTWVSAVVTAGICDSANGTNIDGKPNADIPLDIMILVNNSARGSEEQLKAAYRIAICCISPDPTQKLNILMPLSSYSLDTARVLFRSLPAFQLPHGESSRSRLAGAIKEASNYLTRHSSRGALCHMFIVTAGSTLLIPDDCNGELLRYHTISPENSMVLRSQKSLEGWHLATSFDDEECNYVESTFKEKLQSIIGHLRTGVDSGYLRNLSVRFEAGPDSHIEAVLGETTRDTLRLGESWTMLVKVKPTPGLANVSPGSPVVRFEDKSHVSTASTVDIMIDQLQGMLKPGVYTTDPESRIAATLEYKHSAFPDNAVITTKGRCEIARFQRTVAWEDSVKPPTLQSNANVGRNQCLGVPSDNATIRVKKRQQVFSYLNGNGLQKCVGKENMTPPSSIGRNRLEYGDSPPLGSMNPFKNIVCKRDDFMLSQQSLNQIPEHGHFSQSEDPFVQH
ncbi:uncharacterized protein GIQ15_00768 [Arthroderma uncinatum]|uniref:uncharacterized protein n=1 Tax=Arthroderma uncinatum TaxID=74035 RepID=UPI00144AF393|nr:uncharacterized protein GIQ15_00768 [Arthroderma uncinatum]KAF3491251.1 hypothetical protein GIQ15_00768 [Arthroderma uncinatum]